MEKLNTAVIIAGGEGSRLKPLTDDRPKALIEINGKPLLYWIIQWLKSYDIKHLVIGVAYKKERIYEFMKQNDNFGLKVDFSEHTVEGGTAQGFKLAIKRFIKDENFLAMNGDELTNMDIYKIWTKHNEKKPLVTMAVAPFHCRFSVVEIDDGKISGFRYGHKLPNVPVSMGVYVFNIKVCDVIPEKGSIEDIVFTKLAKDGKMVPYTLSGNEDWISVNTIKDISDAEERIKKWFSKHFA